MLQPADVNLLVSLQFMRLAGTLCSPEGRKVAGGLLVFFGFAAAEVWHMKWPLAQLLYTKSYTFCIRGIVCVPFLKV